MLPNKKKVIKILYLYDFEDWALHNVGKLWLNDIKNLKVTFIKFKDFSKNNFYEYDFIWFGNYDIFLYHYSRYLIKTINLNRCIVSVHDPLELYPQQKNWKEVEINLKSWWDISSLRRWLKFNILKRVKHIITASKEMQLMMKKYGIQSYVIPTMSMLPLRNIENLVTNKCNLLSIFEVYPRKNIDLMNELQNFCKNEIKISFDTKVGKKMLSNKKYIKLLDNHAIYICTSYQEGGPIPAMDAMQRGSIVLSTPVGQIQDLIKDGLNGFICKTHAEFAEKITLLANDFKLLHTMRVKNLEIISKNRNIKRIKYISLKTLKYFSVKNNTETGKLIDTLSNSFFILLFIFTNYIDKRLKKLIYILK